MIVFQSKLYVSASVHVTYKIRYYIKPYVSDITVMICMFNTASVYVSM